MKDSPNRSGAFAADVFDYLLLACIVFMLSICPYTKVEESFNMQATHDMLEFGFLDLKDFDHFKFPGSVPRTFLGSIAVTLLAYPLHLIIKLLGLSKFYSQFAVRLSVSFLSWYSYLKFRNAVNVRFSRRSGEILAILLSCQFHLPFYMSRTLPNTFAMMGCYLAYADWLLGRPQKCLVTIAFFMVIFRCDLLVLLAPLTLTMLLSKEIPFWGTLVLGVAGCLVALLVTGLIDSHFWGRWLWPEGEVLFFNTVENKSSEWGTSPFHYYFTSLIPKTMVVQIILVVLSLLGVHYPLYSMDLAPFPGHVNHKGDLYPAIPSSDTKSTLTSTSSTSSAEIPAQLTFSGSPMVGVFSKVHNKHDSTGLKHVEADESMQAKISLFTFIRNSFFQGYQRTVAYYVLPFVAFVCLYSILPHKELRFIFPIFPMLTLAAALACDALLRPDSINLFLLNIFLSDSYEERSNRSNSKQAPSGDYNSASRQKYLTNKLFRVKMSNASSLNLYIFEVLTSLAIIGCISSTFIYSSIALYASSSNYSGGTAMAALYKSAVPALVKSGAAIDFVSSQRWCDESKTATESKSRLQLFYSINLHIDVLPAERGVTRFLQQDYIKVSYFKGGSSVDYLYGVGDTFPMNARYNQISDILSNKVSNNEGNGITQTPFSCGKSFEDFLLGADFYVRLNFSKEEHLSSFSQFDILITETGKVENITEFGRVLVAVEGLNDEGKKFHFPKLSLLNGKIKIPYLKTLNVPMIKIITHDDYQSDTN